MWVCWAALAVFVACWSGSSSTPGFRKSSNFFYAPGFRSGGPLGPQQNVDGLWTFVAVPIPLENQTLPEGEFPREQVAQAKLWGPIYRPGHGWVYGEAGFILVPRMPPYVPPTILPPPRPLGNGPGGVPPASVAEVSGRGAGSAAQPVVKAPATSTSDDDVAASTEKATMEGGNENATNEKNDNDTKEP